MLPPRHYKKLLHGPRLKIPAWGPLNHKDAASMMGRWDEHLLLSVQEPSLGDRGLRLIIS